jgi:ABC-type transport system involved in cytochrome bd biosynthesis fused ATPase/permease subunit
MTLNFMKRWNRYYCSRIRFHIDKIERSWICGHSGSGKTELAEQLASGNIFVKGSDKWWDGHRNEETIMLDDWRPSEYWRADRTLRILGGIRERVEIKGGSHWLDCK